MEMMYAALLVHKAGKEVNEENMKKVLDAAGVEADAGRIKAVVAALKDSNIDEIIEKASAVAAAPVAVSAAPEAKAEAKKEEKSEEDEEKKEEEAAAGLAGLFG